MEDSAHTGSTFLSGVSLSLSQRSMRVNISANFVAERKTSNEYPQLKQNLEGALSEDTITFDQLSILQPTFLSK